jgi:signal transduction histidine kinase
MGLKVKLGPRLALITTLLMGATLGISVWSFMRLRRVDLESDFKEHALQVGRALQAAMEPVSAEDVEEDLRVRKGTLLTALAPFSLDLIWVAPEKLEDEGWSQVVEAAQIDEAPVGWFFSPQGRPAFFAMAVPLRDGPKSEAGKVLAVLGFRRSTENIEASVWASLKKVLPWLILGVGGFGAMMLGLLRGGVVRPLRRLNDAIEGVAQGDLSRALLPQRDDEIGVLAGRFNAMTDSLREAKAEQERATGARSALEARLRHSEKLATMGQMAAQIAHELGTPLSVIGGRARGMAKKAGDPNEVHKNAEIITGQVERITRIIRQMLNFSRKSRPTLTEVDVPSVVSESLIFVEEALLRHSIVTELELDESVPPIPGDPSEIQQVCLNLLNNAIHAMPSGGQLKVRLNRTVRRKEGLELAAPAEYLVLEICDNGHGVPPELRDRVFEPFFTTKDTGQGTGLGLAVSLGIVKDHDGWIEVGDPPEGGATFRVYLPLVSDPSGVSELAMTAPIGKDQ